MGLNGGGVPRFSPDVEVNMRAIPAFRPSAPDVAIDLLSGVGSALNTVVTGVVKLAEERTKQEAEAAGKQAGAQPGFDPDSLPDDYTVASQTYRKYALQSYTTQMELAREEAFNQFQMEWESTPEAERDPALLQSRFHSWIEGHASQMPADLAVSFRQLSATKANPIILSATKDYLGKQRQRAVSDNEAHRKLIRARILEKPLPHNEVEQQAYDAELLEYKQLLDASDLTENQRMLEADTLLDELREAAVITGFRESSDKLAALEAFMQGGDGVDGVYTPEQKERLISKMQGIMNDEDFLERQKTVELTFEQKLALEEEQNTIEERVDNADITMEELETWGYQRKDFISPDWLANQKTALRKKQQGLLDEEQALVDLENGAPFDPSDGDTKKRLNALWARRTGTAAPRVPVAGAVVSSGFGSRSAPMAGASTNHKGVDYAAPAGTAIRPTVAGKVTFSGPAKGFGNLVEIVQADGYTVRYGHNQKNLVKTGDSVAVGQAIGLVGATGNATGPHAHIEVIDPNGKRVNPASYFSQPTRPPVQSEEALIKEAARFAKKFRMIPEVFVNETVGWLNGGPEDQLKAIKRIAFLRDARVELDDFHEDDIALALRVDEDLRRGVPALKALEMAKLEMDPANANLIEANKGRLETILKKPENQVERVFEEGGIFGMFKSLPAIPITGAVMDDLHADWSRLYSNAFLKTGGKEAAARELAVKDIQALYGVTEVDGSRRLMKLPPERFYKIYGQGKDDDWLRKQLYEDVKKLTGKAYQPGRLFIHPDAITARESQAKKPTYKIMVINDDGVIDELRVQGKGARFVPEPNREISRVKTAQQKEASKKLAQAVEKRKAKLPPPQNLSDSGALAARKGLLRNLPKNADVEAYGRGVVKNPNLDARGNLLEPSGPDMADGGAFAREQAERREAEALAKKQRQGLTAAEMKRLSELMRKY